MKKILKYFSTLIFLVLFFALLFYFYLQDYLKTTIHNPKVIFIPKGSTKYVYNYLNKKGLNLNLLDYYLIKFYGYPQAGWLDFKDANLSRREFFYKITHLKALGVNFTIIPGETTVITLQNLAKRFDLNVTKLHIFYKKYAHNYYQQYEQHVLYFSDKTVFFFHYRVCFQLGVDVLIKQPGLDF